LITKYVDMWTGIRKDRHPDSWMEAPKLEAYHFCLPAVRQSVCQVVLL